jgi:ATP-dependent protease HslVU (ClpYQ) peptidase subunit
MANRAVDLVITYRVIKLLATPFERQEAFKYGIIDKDGNVLRKFRTLKTTAEKKAYTMLHRFVFNLKRILAKAGLGGRLGTFAVALGLLIREDKNYKPYQQLIERAVVTYLKDTNQYETLLKEEGDVSTVEPEELPFITCFGVDVYERGEELISEYEYAKTL